MEFRSEENILKKKLKWKEGEKKLDKNGSYRKTEVKMQ